MDTKVVEREDMRVMGIRTTDEQAAILRRWEEGDD